MNSAFRDGGATLQRWPQTPAFMNPDDMEALGFAEDDVVEIVSEAGTVTGAVQPDSTMRPGVISMPHQWGGEGIGGHTNELVSLDRNLTNINFTCPDSRGFPFALAHAVGPCDDLPASDLACVLGGCRRLQMDCSQKSFHGRLEGHSGDLTSGWSVLGFRYPGLRFSASDRSLDTPIQKMALSQ